MAQTIPQGLKKYRQARAKGKKEAIIRKWTQTVTAEGKLTAETEINKEAQKRASVELRQVRW